MPCRCIAWAQHGHSGKNLDCDAIWPRDGRRHGGFAMVSSLQRESTQRLPCNIAHAGGSVFEYLDGLLALYPVIVVLKTIRRQHNGHDGSFASAIYRTSCTLCRFIRSIIVGAQRQSDTGHIYTAGYQPIEEIIVQRHGAARASVSSRCCWTFSRNTNDLTTKHRCNKFR
jgi:hypothetical protein